MISLVLTTYHRFDSFLSKNMEKYLTNDLFQEIVVLDDCSDDYDKLKTKYGNNDKIKIHRQPQNVGVYRNKVAAMNLASSDWICLMDSDNFCARDYFDALAAFWRTHGQDENTIYCPVRAGPFDYSKWVNTTIDKSNWNRMHEEAGILLNTGNYVFHRSIMDKLHGSCPDACDVIYANYVWVKAGCALRVVPNMTYDHVVHDGSVYLKTQELAVDFIQKFDWNMQS